MAATIWDYIRMVAPPQHHSTLPLLINNDNDFMRKLSVLTTGNSLNRVLLFPGSFNPPHQGHRAILNHTLKATMTSLNIRGAIIFPHDDDQVQEKLKDKEYDRVFPKDSRALWWRKGGAPKHHSWVFDGTRKELNDILTHLRRRLIQDRFVVEFILLVGPDWISSTAVYDPGLWKCNSAITCDISRPVDFRGEWTLRQISGCSMWQQHPLDERATLEASEDVKRGSLVHPPYVCSTDVALTLTKGYDVDHAASDGIFWSCHFLRKPMRRFFFLPCSHQDSLSGSPPSSSKIREWLGSDHDIRAQLGETLALCPLSVVEMDLKLRLNGQESNASYS